MIRRTYGQIKDELRRVAGATGLRTDDARIMARFNEATEELMNAGDWPGVVDRYQFRVYSGHIILPYFLDRILGVAVNNTAYSLRSPWYEFVEYGPGTQSQCNWIDAVIDRDETPLQVPMPCGTSWTLYTKCELDERGDGERPQMLVTGRMGNMRNVRTYAGTSWMDGEYLELNGDTDPYTFAGTALFSEITGVVKPETQGYVELWATNGTSVELLASYSPEETNPSYHAYFLPRLSHEIECCCRQCNDYDTTDNRYASVLVRARKRFIPVNGDNDNIIISNLPAMKAMVMAIQMRDTNNMDGYAANRMTAVNIMNEEALRYRGRTRTPVLTFARGASLGAMPYVR